MCGYILAPIVDYYTSLSASPSGYKGIRANTDCAGHIKKRSCKTPPAFFQRHSGSVQEHLPILNLTKTGHEGIEVNHEINNCQEGNPDEDCKDL
jgi:hypothetical protein